MIGWRVGLAVLGIVPWILLAVAVTRLRRRRVVDRSAVVVVAAIGVVVVPGPVLRVLGVGVPAWWAWLSVAFAVVVGYGFLARQSLSVRK